MPSLQLIEQLTGRYTTAIIKALDVLVEREFIQWTKPDPHSIVILKAWEDNFNIMRDQSGNSGIEYFTVY